MMNALQRFDHALLKDADCLVGVDEAGRGCLAGPVVAGACVLHARFFQSKEALAASAAINDSKQLSAARRGELLETMRALQSERLIDFATGSASVEEIESHNILGATRLAMRRALETLQERADGWSLLDQLHAAPLFSGAAGKSRVRLCVDGRPLRPFPYAHQAIVKGDSCSLGIAMASIAAKTARDQLLQVLAERYPQYGFEKHKGYGTTKHREAIRQHGPCPIHRSLFLRKVLPEQKQSSP